MTLHVQTDACDVYFFIYQAWSWLSLPGCGARLSHSLTFMKHLIVGWFRVGGPGERTVVWTEYRLRRRRSRPNFKCHCKYTQQYLSKCQHLQSSAPKRFFPNNVSWYVNILTVFDIEYKIYFLLVLQYMLNSAPGLFRGRCLSIGLVCKIQTFSKAVFSAAARKDVRCLTALSHLVRPDKLWAAKSDTVNSKRSNPTDAIRAETVRPPQPPSPPSYQPSPLSVLLQSAGIEKKGSLTPVPGGGRGRTGEEGWGRRVEAVERGLGAFGVW